MSDHFGHILRAAITKYGALAVDRIARDSDLIRTERKRKWRKKHPQRTIQNAASRLFRLPAEIRNQIYELVVVREGIIDVVQLAPDRRHFRLSPDLKQPRLSRVCRQLRHEALSVFYAKNNFRITVIARAFAPLQQDECLAIRWLRNLGERNHKSLGSIEIRTTESSADLTSQHRYSTMYNVAEDRVCGGIHYPYYYASEPCLDGWTWKGDIEVDAEEEQFWDEVTGTPSGQLHHHALSWDEEGKRNIDAGFEGSRVEETPSAI